MKRVLIIAYYFPPLGGIGSIRVMRYAQLLPEFGWEPTVIAPKGTPHAIDPTLSTGVTSVIRARSDLRSATLRDSGVRQPEVGELRRRAGSGATWNLDSAGPHPRRSRLSRCPGRLVSRGVDRGPSLSPTCGRRRDFLIIQPDHRPSDRPASQPGVRPSLGRRVSRPLERSAASRTSSRAAGRAIGREARSGRHSSGGAHPTLGRHWEERWGRSVDLIMNGHDVVARALPAAQPPALTHVGTYYPGEADFPSASGRAGGACAHGTSVTATVLYRPASGGCGARR